MMARHLTVIRRMDGGPVRPRSRWKRVLVGAVIGLALGFAFWLASKFGWL